MKDAELTTTFITSYREIGMQKLSFHRYSLSFSGKGNSVFYDHARSGRLRRLGENLQTSLRSACIF